MNAPLQVRQPSAGGIPALMMEEAELVSVLQNSIYPGAKLESIKMVVSYCRAGGLDPLQKPVHIVPMDVSTGEKDGNGWDIKVKRDVIMPGIGLYRTQAARTGQYLGQSEPEFGPVKVIRFKEKRVEWENGQKREKWVDVELEYPEWCKVTVSRLLPTGEVAKHTACERWTENYATKGYDGAPNAMWRKRPYGQLAKCTEAQALRKAFPEDVGAAPTAEEMEGKSFDDLPTGATIDGETGEVLTQKPAAPMPARRSAANQQQEQHAPEGAPPADSRKPASTEPQDSGTAPRLIDSSRVNFLRKKATAFEQNEANLCKPHGVERFEDLTEAQFEEVKAELVKL